MSNKKYMNAYMKNRYEQRRQDAIIFLGGNCIDCGTANNLQFHHKDPSIKQFTIARGSSRSNKLFWAEVNKCVLLCSGCHRARHKVVHPCGAPQKYWQGCKCDDCKQAYAAYCLEYNQRRRST